MVEWTKEQINEILNLRGADGELIDVFDLFGLLYIGTCKPEYGWDKILKRMRWKSMWNLDKTFIRRSSHSISLSLDVFEWCENEEQVREAYHEALREAIIERLI